MAGSRCTLLVILCLAACGGGRPIDAVDAASTSDHAGEVVQICDGRDSIRLAVAIGGGGQATPGQAMLSENGWQFLLVNGRCQAWVLRSSDVPLRGLALSAEQEQTLSAALQLSTWPSLAGSRPGGGCFDAPSIRYRFDDLRIAGPVCGLQPGDPLQSLNTMFSAQLESLYAAASPVRGDVRYLVLVGDGSPLDSRPPMPWPLSVPLETIALPPEAAFSGTRGMSRLATGSDAERLHKIRTTDSTGSGSTFDYTRVAAEDGTTYELYVRDAVPGEQPDGLLPPGTF